MQASAAPVERHASSRAQVAPPVEPVATPERRVPRIEVRAAVHAYGRREVLRGTDLDLYGGEIYGLLGPNGAGKTTLMKAICGRIRLAVGTIRIDGRDPAQDRQARRAVSFVPQEISIYPHLTVKENLKVFGRFAGVARREVDGVVEHMLVRAGLHGRAHQVCRTLSGGYQRRVNICASLLQKPAALVLDEPTVGIDIDAREAVHALLHDLKQQGTAVLIATHDLEQAEALCDRIGLMRHGCIEFEGAPADLIRATFGTDKEVLASLREPPTDWGDAVLRDMGFRPTQSPLMWYGRAAAGSLDGGALHDHLHASGLAVKEIRIREPDLSSLFLELVDTKSAP